jgi:hypothetical protein
MNDEYFYGLAADELTTRTHSEALMAKAYALAMGDSDKARALYIGLRADQLKDEAARLISSSIAEEKRERELTAERIKSEAELANKQRKLAAEKIENEQKKLKEHKKNLITQAKAEKRRLVHENIKSGAKSIIVRLGWIGLLLIGLFLILGGAQSIYDFASKNEWGASVFSGLLIFIGYKAVRKARDGYAKLQ